MENKVIKPTDGPKDTHIRFLPVRGMDIKRESVTLDHEGKPFKYEGMLIPHAEIFSMSRFFQYKGNTPSIMYIYRPSDITMDSLNRFRKNDYKPLPKEYFIEKYN